MYSFQVASKLSLKPFTYAEKARSYSVKFVVNGLNALKCIVDILEPIISESILSNSFVLLYKATVGSCDANLLLP